MLIFGQYSFSIDEYTGFEINLPNVFERNDFVQLKVSVFHVFWIPLFPFNKQWVLTRNGEELVVNPEASKLLDRHKGRKRVPWYSFSWLFLIPVLFIFYSVYSKVDERIKHKQRVANNTKWIQKKTDAIMNPEKGDYYVITNVEYPSSVFKVIDFSRDSTIIQVPTVKEQLYWGGGNFSKWDDYFADGSKGFRKVRVAKEDLDAACTKNVENLSRFKGAPIPGVTDGRLLKIDRVERRRKNRN